MSRPLNSRQTTTNNALVRPRPSDLNQLASAKPGALQVALLSQPAEQLQSRIQALLQHQFSHSTDVVVQVRADSLLRQSLDCPNDLEMHSNPLGGRVSEALSACLRDLSANVETMKDLCFHPWSDADQRATWVSQLNVLVMKLLTICKKTKRGPGIGYGGGMTALSGTWSYHPNDIAVMIINRFFEIAMCGYSDEDIAVFAARWPLPTALEKSSSLLSDLAGYFRNIRPTEQAYVLSLAELVLEQVQSRKVIEA